MTETAKPADALGVAAVHEGDGPGALRELLDLLMKQGACLESLASISTERAEKIEQGGDPEAIDQTLAARQRLLDQLMQTQSKWDAAGSAVVVASLGADARKELDAAVEAVSRLREEALGADRRLSAAVGAVAGRLSGELRQTFKGGKAIGAYRAPVPSDAPRFTDQTG